MCNGSYMSSDSMQLPAGARSSAANEGGDVVVSAMMCDNDVEPSWSADCVRGNNTLGVSIRSGFILTVGNDETREGGWLRRLRLADAGTTWVSLGVSRMICNLGDVSVTGYILGGGFGSDFRRLCPLRRTELVVGAAWDNVVGGWRGTVIWIGCATTLGDEVFVGDGVGAMALLVLNILASWSRAYSWTSLMGANSVPEWGFCSEVVRSLAASIEVSVEEVAGMLYKWGGNLTLMVIHSVQVLGMYNLWHL